MSIESFVLMCQHFFVNGKYSLHLCSCRRPAFLLPTSLKICGIMGILYLCLFVSHGAEAQRGPWPPHSRSFLITHNDTPQSVGLLWTSDQLVAETST
jgi:hypothetical protein